MRILLLLHRPPFFFSSHFFLIFFLCTLFALHSSYLTPSSSLIFQDFFRRHSGGVNLKERCESLAREPISCHGGKTSRNCQFHRYERCLEVGMQPVAAKSEWRE